ncbi:aspartate aminotransferase [Orenia metallireducens]|uniref:Aspartate aminotransferase n=1 Tax=Orenia metallireducens TaxID=1413210 RepID=A0A1C0A8I5_9FIRM|nr:PLP-dependent aminotransferase family protein [Orenia metallireducens]OCL26524.1 aspartate aminotransferase [Orenia metallireducens]
MRSLFAKRINDIPKSFIREILKVIDNPEIISFAGGLPNPEFFPVEEIKEASNKVLAEDGTNVLQYSTTEGYLPLREYIADRYFKKQGLKISPEQILITNGSQQGLDLIGKTFLNEGDGLIIEEPGYLGAIQSFSFYRPKFNSVPLLEDGVDLEVLKDTLAENDCKLFYGVPNFQNPSGITYSDNKRRAVAKLLEESNTIFVEDDPYGELRFIGEDIPLIKNYLKDNTILLGSFSKIVAPAFRLGWVVMSMDKMEKAIVAKQASDLHSNYFAQRVIYQYLIDNDIDQHISRIKEVYGRQREMMVNSIKEYFPPEISFTEPEGGMFLWITLPKELSSLELFDMAIKEKVAFVPGSPFYVNGQGKNTLRLNYSNVAEEKIEEGIKSLAKVIKRAIN